MNNGYIKLWRKSLDDGWLKNHKLWVLWCWCLMRAAHSERDIIVGNSRIRLLPGDFVFGRNSLAAELGMSVQSLRTMLKFLKNQKNITIKSTNKFSICSIVNWSTYQQDILSTNQLSHQPANQQLTSNQPATNQQLTTNKNGRMEEWKNEKKKHIGEKIVLPDWIPKDAWDGFVAMRKEIKKPLTGRAIQLAIAKLGRLRDAGENVGKALDESTLNRWSGIYTPKKEVADGERTATSRFQRPGERITGAAGSQRSDDPEVERIKELFSKSKSNNNRENTINAPPENTAISPPPANAEPF